MGLNWESAKKLGSLSALGAGAIALTADRAEASIIYSGPIDLKVGFDCSCEYAPFVREYLTGPNLIGQVFFSFYTRFKFNAVPHSVYFIDGWGREEVFAPNVPGTFWGDHAP